jgi:non-specific serine/threonine protein kinase/serine/threonine-protein kinase
LGKQVDFQFNILDEAPPTVAPSNDTRWSVDQELLEGATRALPGNIGPYRIVRRIGEGGMGIVYEAEQERPRRIVALKIIKPGFAGPELRRRFEYESWALGRLHHPGIAQIYEGGAADNGFGAQPYFAMEFIHGKPLVEYADSLQLTLRQRLDLILKICEGVHHAHQRGLIHRDLKPGNILVDDTGQPKILDFGVARAIDSSAPASGETVLGQLVGTLAYMSPEQTLGDPLEIDVRSDVYSLGLVLYELLAGHPAYHVGKALPEAVRIIREEEPAPLGAIHRTYGGDLEIIVAKTLEKDRSRRYGSAAELAADIRRYLEKEPIVARAPSSAYRLGKFVHRHKSLVAVTVALFVVLVAGIVATTWQAARATQAGYTALQERDRSAAAEKKANRERDRALEAERAATAAEAQASLDRNRAVSEKERANTEAATARAINSFLQDDLLAQAGASAQVEGDSRPDPNLKVRTALDRAAARIGGRFADQPLVEASIRQTIGSTYVDLGLYVEAQPEIERAVRLRRRVLGDDHPATLESLSWLARVLRGRGQYAAAEALLRKIVEVRRRVLGEAHRDTLASMSLLASVYRIEAKDVQASALLAEVLELQRRVLGDEHPETLVTMDNLAGAERNQGKYEEAHRLFTKALESRRRVLGAEHPDTLLSMTHLALELRYEGKYSEAEALWSRLLETYRKVRGDEHVDTLTTMNTLAILYRLRGRYAQAEEMLTKALEIERRKLGDDHPTTLLSMGELPGVYLAQGKYAQAEIGYIKILEIYRRLLGEEHRDTVRVMNNLSSVYLSQANYAEAEALLDKALEINRRLRGETHPMTMLNRHNLAVLQWNQGRFRRAEAAFMEVLAARRRILGEEHPETLTTMESLSSEYVRQGRFSEGESLLAKILEARRRTMGEEHPDTLQSMNSLAMLYRGRGEYSRSEPLFNKVIELRRWMLGEQHSDALAAMYGLAVLYQGQGRYSQAENLFAKILEGRRRVLGTEHPATSSVLKSLGAVRLLQNRYAEAEPLLREALRGREKKSPDAWERYQSESMLGTSLAGQGRYAEAEPLMLSGYRGIVQRASAVPYEERSAIEQSREIIFRLYKMWDKPEKAAYWSRNPELDAIGSKLD